MIKTHYTQVYMIFEISFLEDKSFIKAERILYLPVLSMLSGSVHKEYWIEDAIQVDSKSGWGYDHSVDIW